MTNSVSLEAAQATLFELLLSLQPGEEIAITNQGVPVAYLKRAVLTSWPCQAGTAKNEGYWMAPDFDAPLDDFAEYME